MTISNDDRKLLEMAAKAAGVFMRRKDWPFTDNFDPECLQTHYDNNEQSLTGTRLFYCDDGEIGGTEEYTWSPLTDDGDALRLAVKLGLSVSTPSDKYPQAFANEWHGLGPTAYAVPAKNDPYAATRRAIVGTAAEIGRALELSGH